MKQDVQLIMDAGKLDIDSAQGTVDAIEELGISSLKSVELVSNNYGVVLRITDSKNNVYYLGYGGLGYLEIIRRDSIDGEIIYMMEN